MDELCFICMSIVSTLTSLQKKNFMFQAKCFHQFHLINEPKLQLIQILKKRQELEGFEVEGGSNTKTSHLVSKRSCIN